VDLKSLFAFRAIDFFLSSFLVDGFVGLKSQWCTAELGELIALYKKDPGALEYSQWLQGGRE
jgi:hypothetical protein